ncbi:MAG: methyltransferase domain-containing protein [bacterium]
MSRTIAPSAVERSTRAWLDGTMDPGIADAGEAARAVYDDSGRPQRVSRYHFGRLRRKLRIFRCLDRLEFDSLLDVASGWDHFPWLVRERYGADTYYSDMVHRMNLPLDGEAFGKLDHAVTMRLPRLPFADGAFDVVLCSEVLEHLVRPVEAIAELRRVARRAVILTSLEALSVNRWERWLSHHRVDVRVPHVDRTFLLHEEISALFGTAAQSESLVVSDAEPCSPFAPVADQEAACAALDEVDRLAAALCRSTAALGGRGAMGILVVAPTTGTVLRPPRPEQDDALARWLISMAAREEGIVRETLALAEIIRRDPERTAGAAIGALLSRPIAPALRARLRCPACRSALDAAETGLACASCGRRFAGELGVPMLSLDDDGSDTLAAALDALCGADAPHRAVLTRLAHRLRRNEPPPGVARRSAWWLEHRLGLWPRPH